MHLTTDQRLARGSRGKEPTRDPGDLLLVVVAACGSKPPADQAQDELNAGLAADAAGNTDEAATHYQKCLTFETTNRFCIFNLGVQAQNAGRALEAENAYRLALMQDPDFPSALYNLAILRIRGRIQRRGDRPLPAPGGGRPEQRERPLQPGPGARRDGRHRNGQNEINEGIQLNPALVAPRPPPRPRRRLSRPTAPTPEPTPQSRSPEPTPVPTKKPKPTPS